MCTSQSNIFDNASRDGEMDYILQPFNTKSFQGLDLDFPTETPSQLLSMSENSSAQGSLPNSIYQLRP